MHQKHAINLYQSEIQVTNVNYSGKIKYARSTQLMQVLSLSALCSEVKAEVVSV